MCGYRRVHVCIFERVISQLITLCVVIAAEACSGLSIIHQRIVRAYLSATFSILDFEEREEQRALNYRISELLSEDINSLLSELRKSLLVEPACELRLAEYECT